MANQTNPKPNQQPSIGTQWKEDLENQVNLRAMELQTNPNPVEQGNKEKKTGTEMDGVTDKGRIKEEKADRQGRMDEYGTSTTTGPDQETPQKYMYESDKEDEKQTPEKTLDELRRTPVKAKRRLARQQQQMPRGMKSQKVLNFHAQEDTQEEWTTNHEDPTNAGGASPGSAAQETRDPPNMDKAQSDVSLELNDTGLYYYTPRHDAGRSDPSYAPNLEELTYAEELTVNLRCLDPRPCDGQACIWQQEPRGIAKVHNLAESWESTEGLDNHFNRSNTTIAMKNGDNLDYIDIFQLHTPFQWEKERQFLRDNRTPQEVWLHKHITHGDLMQIIPNNRMVITQLMPFTKKGVIKSIAKTDYITLEVLMSESISKPNHMRRSVFSNIREIEIDHTHPVTFPTHTTMFNQMMGLNTWQFRDPYPGYNPNTPPRQSTPTPTMEDSEYNDTTLEISFSEEEDGHPKENSANNKPTPEQPHDPMYLFPTQPINQISTYISTQRQRNEIEATPLPPLNNLDPTNPQINVLGRSSDSSDDNRFENSPAGQRMTPESGSPDSWPPATYNPPRHPNSSSSPSSTEDFSKISHITLNYPTSRPEYDMEDLIQNFDSMQPHNQNNPQPYQGASGYEAEPIKRLIRPTPEFISDNTYRRESEEDLYGEENSSPEKRSNESHPEQNKTQWTTFETNTKPQGYQFQTNPKTETQNQNPWAKLDPFQMFSGTRSRIPSHEKERLNSNKMAKPQTKPQPPHKNQQAEQEFNQASKEDTPLLPKGGQENKIPTHETNHTHNPNTNPHQNAHQNWQQQVPPPNHYQNQPQPPNQQQPRPQPPHQNQHFEIPPQNLQQNQPPPQNQHQNMQPQPQDQPNYYQYNQHARFQQQPPKPQNPKTPSIID